MSKKETKVIALNVIQRTIKPGEFGDRAKGIPGIKPVIQTIDPGAVFMASNEVKPGQVRSEYDELLRSGAIRDYSAEDHAVYSRLSNVIGGGQFEEDEGTAAVTTKTEKVIKPKKPAKEAAAAEGDGKGAIKSKAPAKDAPAGESEGDGEDGEANDVV